MNNYTCKILNHVLRYISACPLDIINVIQTAFYVIHNLEVPIHSLPEYSEVFQII